MSIKLKIGWTDNNAIIEGVRIYKSSSLFDVNTLPAVHAEITDGSLFYEDFDVIEGQTYFYMLSCFLGDREVFTECYNVVASAIIPVDLPKITAITSTVSVPDTGFSGINTAACWFTEGGASLCILHEAQASVGTLMIFKITCSSPYNITPGATRVSFNSGLSGLTIGSVSFFRNGAAAVVAYVKSSGLWHYAILECVNKYDLEGAIVRADYPRPLNSYGHILISEDGKYHYHFGQETPTIRYEINGNPVGVHTLINPVSFNLYQSLGSLDVVTAAMSSDGLKMIVIVGGLSQQKSIISVKLNTPFDLSSEISRNILNRGTVQSLYRNTRTNRFLYSHDGQSYLLLGRNSPTPAGVFREYVNTEEWI